MGTEPVSSVDSQGRVDLVIYQQLEIFSFFPTSVVALAATDFGVILSIVRKILNRKLIPNKTLKL